MLNVSYNGPKGNFATPLASMFFHELILAIFIEGLFLSNCIEFYLIVSEKISNVFLTALSHVSWRPCFLTDQIGFIFFVDGHLLSIYAELFWYQRR